MKKKTPRLKKNSPVEKNTLGGKRRKGRKRRRRKGRKRGRRKRRKVMVGRLTTWLECSPL